jgi:hypothetical protein
MGHNAQHKYSAANLNSASSPVIKINSQPLLFDHFTDLYALMHYIPPCICLFRA